MKKIFQAIFFLGSLFFSSVLNAAEEMPRLPTMIINGAVVTPSIQDLSGVGTKPLQALVKRNNKDRKDQVIQVHAAGVDVGDELRLELGPLAPGVRVTLFKLLRVKGCRYLTMPFSIYAGESREAVYHEKIVPYQSEYLIVAFEKVGSPTMKSDNSLYFEERIRNLVVSSIKPNFKFSSLRFKMKDLAGDKKTFSKDVQDLIDRFIQPQRIFVFRLWKVEY